MIDQLFAFIADARRRWKLRVALRGTAWLAVTVLAVVVLASWWMDRLRFTPFAIVAASVVVWLVAAMVAWRALRPLRRRISDAEVALYLEEHEPALGGAMLAAVEHARGENAAVSRGLSLRLVDDAVRRASAATAWPTIERRGIAQASSVLAAAALVTVILGVTRPDFIANGARALIPVVGLAARPYTIGTSPGDTTIPRGADVAITGTLRGFNAEAADLLVRREGSADWEHLAMTQTGRGREYAALLFNVRAPLTWVIEAAGVRSPEHVVRVADLPWVDKIRTVLELPAYTRVAPRESESGDVAGLPGSRVTVRVRPTLPVSRAAIALDSDTVALAPADDGTLAGTFTLRTSGEYRVLFPGLDGQLGPGSPAYVVEVLEDLPPVVRLTRPGRDADATPIDEAFLEAQAEDDFGVAQLELMYRVNGGDERTVSLYGATPRTDVVAGHTLFLEEMNLQPGDVISYYARVRDARPGAPAVTSDIYFLTIRPFDRAFREAEQNGGGGQGGVDAGELSERQRQIVAGTFRVIQGKAGTTEAERRDNLATLALAQGRLREEVETLLRRLRTRGVAQQDPTMGPVAAALDTGVTAMAEAEQQLGRRAPDQALTPEQRALAMLQRAEAVFNREREVARGQNGRGGGGGGAASAEELADLFTLELDRMRNQYETVQQGRQQQQAQQADSLLERLRELARRQQQENARRGTDTRGTTAANQRRMAAEADSIARQLERLSHERDQQQLADAARRTREAANQMRQGAADPTAGSDALERLREAAGAMEQGRTEAARRGVDQATERARRLQQQQRDVAQGVNSLPADGQQRQDQIRRLAAQKDSMAAEVNALQTEMERLSRENQRQGQAEAARRLREAARGLAEGRVEDKIRYSRGVMQGRSPDYARSFEESISSDIDSLAQRLSSAAGTIGETREDRIARQLERARDVADAIETMAERSRQAQRAQQSSQQDAEQGSQQNGQSQQSGQQNGQQGQQSQQNGQQNAEQGSQQRGSGAPNGGGTPRGGDARANQAETQRQLDRELRERERELGDIRDALRREGVDVSDLEGLMGGFRADNNGPIGTPRGLEQLERNVVPGLREFEFGVRRDVFGTPRTPTLVGETRVPESFRAQVERYYRSLSERR